MTTTRRQFLAASAVAVATPLLAADREVPLTIIVTDPLSKELSCPCVAGYAQRDYKDLGKFLSEKIGKPVVVEFGESLEGALTKKTAGKVDIIIGKDSVIRAQAKAKKFEIAKLAGLTGQDGLLTQEGWLVVHSSDPTLSADQMKNYQILFGPPAAEEKNAAARALLKDLNVAFTAVEKDAASCTDCATKLLDYAKTGEKVCGVISSYAAPLLEGCGTVKKGDLKVIGKTDPVPFIAAFVCATVPADVQKKIQTALLEVSKNEALCKVLETKEGFVLTDDKGTKKVDEGWTDWRGPERSGRVPHLPTKLPAAPTVLWQVPLASNGLGGVAATTDLVIVSDRELNDTMDAWKCFAASDGKPRWSIRTPAAGNLDYGNSPRATAVIAGGRAYLAGAFGHLACVDLTSGESLWDTNLRDEYEPPEAPKWGACATPLILDDRVIVNPGAKDASLVALDAKTGKPLWKTPGKAAGYGSFIAMTVRGKMQIVGHDAVSLGGWNPATGERLWTVLPEKPSDFNVPTPIALDHKLLVTTENNGTRLYEFDEKGKLKPTPVAVNRKLAPDIHTPVVVAGRVLGVWRRLFCLDLAKGLKEIWSEDDVAFTKYCAIVADDKRALVITMAGELILVDATASEFTPLGRLKALENEAGLYSHPAFVGNRLYLRGSNSLTAIEI